MRLVQDRWKLVTYYDMQPYWYGKRIFNTYLGHLQTLCTKSETENTHYEIILQQLIHGLTELEHYDRMLLSDVETTTDGTGVIEIAGGRNILVELKSADTSERCTGGFLAHAYQIEPISNASGRVGISGWRGAERSGAASGERGLRSACWQRLQRSPRWASRCIQHTAPGRTNVSPTKSRLLTVMATSPPQPSASKAETIEMSTSNTSEVIPKELRPDPGSNTESPEDRPPSSTLRRNADNRTNRSNESIKSVRKIMDRELEPSLSVTEQNLADRVRYINNIFGDAELEPLRREAIPSSNGNATAGNAAPLDAQQTAYVDAAVKIPFVAN
ncbi:unnamed protein product [Parnassius apollo]|uniref:(apollo) hypothetical protein n=1 Tax=Parnassius apollo TaxID=110799 RepID=A0A8S3W1A9_PARAO|nr:unnamed protein product [Parnassius apollo]